jgi:hypothetical protein
MGVSRGSWGLSRRLATTLFCLLALVMPGSAVAQELEAPVIDAVPAQPDAPPEDSAEGRDAATPDAHAEAVPGGGETTERRQSGVDSDGDDSDDASVGTAQTDRDCPDFATQEEAQDYFRANGGDENNNVDNLDADGDGIACEDLPSRSADGTPVGGVDTGWGGTAAGPDDPAPLAFVLTGVGLGLLAGWVAALAIRRRRPSA